MPRNPKLTPSLIDDLAGMLSDGALITHATRALGIQKRTLSTWRKAGIATYEERFASYLASGRTDDDLAAEAKHHQIETPENPTREQLCHALAESFHLHRVLVDTIEESIAKARVAAIRTIRKAADGGTWQAAAWYLERTDPKNFAQTVRTKQELTGKDGGPIATTTEGESPAEELRRTFDEVGNRRLKAVGGNESSETPDTGDGTG